MSTVLTGTVTVPGGEPALGAVVELHNSGGDTVDQVQVNTKGGFTYYLSSGTWTLTVWDGIGNRGGAQVRMDEGEQKVCNVEIDHPQGGRT